MKCDRIKSFSLGIALAVCTALSGALLVTTPAQAQFAVFDPVNYVQNFLTQLRAVQSNINEVQQLANQLQQYQNMLRNTESLSGGDWAGASNAINRLSGILEQGQAMAITSGDFDAEFRARFPGYEAQEDYSESYRRWSETSQDSVLSAMRVANVQAQGIQTEQQALERLRLAASTTDGQKSAIDASNQIALAQVEQLQQLRELMMAQVQAHGTYMAAEEQRSAALEAQIQRSLRYKDPWEGFTPRPAEIK